MVEILVPISMFAMILGIIWVISASNAKSRVEIQRTIQSAISNNTELTPQVIQALGAKPEKPFADLRSGVVLIAVALGIFVLGGGISSAENDPEVMSIMMGVAAFPGFIGVALIGMHFFLKGKDGSNG